MIEKRMLVSLAAALGVLLLLLVFGRGLISRFHDEVIETRRAMETRVRGAATGPAVGETATEGAQPVGPTNASVEAVQGEAAPPTPPVEPEPTRREDPPAPPNPDAVRDSAEAEVAALGPLHDEFIEVLEAIHDALVDREEKRRARGRVTMARFAKGQEVEGLAADVAAEPEWRVRNARRSAARATTRLEREIGEARATLARIRGEGKGREGRLCPTW